MSRFLDALHCRNSGRPPVWLMRQAGRYLPEYRHLRAQHSIETMFRTPDLAFEVTMQPIRRYGLDAAILFADILTPCDAFGLDVTFEGGPVVKGTPKPFELKNVEYVARTIQLLKKELSVPLIGFCGGPYTVNKYLDKKIPRTKLVEATISYLKMQIAAGVDAIQIFDSWAGHLPKAEFCAQVLPDLKEIVDAIRPFPTIVFTRGSCHLIDELVSLEPTGISFDWDLPMKKIRERVPAHIAVQGNINPELLKQPQQKIFEEVSVLAQSMAADPGFILNLGHGMTPDLPVESVTTLLEAASSIELPQDCLQS